MDHNVALPGNGAPAMRALALVFALALAPARPGPAADCNGNGASDDADVASGTSLDCDANGVPDECEGLPLLVGSVVSRVLPGAAGEVAIGDLDGDGRPDLAVATGAPNVTVFLDPLAVADGLANMSMYAVPGLACGDLDGDGDLDLAMSRATDIRTLLNAGDGTFPTRSFVAQTGAFTSSRIADLDGDGANDVVASRGDRGAVAAFRGTGGGAFAAPVDLAVDSPGAPAPADVDGDGHLDVLLLDGTGAIQVLRNGGDGALASKAPIAAAGGGLLAFASGDIDGDGLPDIAAIDASRILILSNSRDAGFALRSTYALGAGAVARVVAIGDLDADGMREVVLGRTRSDAEGEYGILRPAPGGGLESTIAVGVAGPPGSLGLKDLDGDGADELIAAQEGADGVTIVRRHGNNVPAASPLAFRTRSHSLAGFGNFEPHMPFLADLDGDGRLDLATMNGEYRVMALRNQGDGTQGNETIYDLRDADELVAIAPADLDGDGHIDIAAVDESTDFLLVLTNRGDGTFVQTSQSARTDERPYFVVAADLDGDGDLDVATANEQAASIGVFRNRGGASLEDQVSLPVGPNPMGLVAADLDGDGDRDLAVGKSGDSQVSILRNDGMGIFGDRADHAAGKVNHLSGSDLDGDGDLDLVAARESEKRITMLRAVGGGAFEIAEALDVGQPPRSAIAADVDRDRLPDLVSANEDTDTISILRGAGGGSFGPPAHYTVGDAPRFVVAGDLDGDGDIDLVVANHTSYDFTFFFNETAALPSVPPPRDRICTALAYFHLAAPPAADGFAELEVPYLVPARQDSALLATTFLPAERGRPVREALAALYPERFGGLTSEGYRALVARRATRQYFAGSVLRLRLPGRIAWGFTVDTDAALDPGERIAASEAGFVWQALDAAFLLDPFAYFPDTAESRAEARAWGDPGFPVLIRDPPVPFLRGDVDPNGAVDISDAIGLLAGLYLDGTIPCVDASDANDDGAVDLSDALKILFHIFGSGRIIPEPSGACGFDPTDDGLTCVEVPACR
jgi:hypothetical protein